MTSFAGKDLFWGMDTWLQENGFEGSTVFKERVLSGIEKSTDDVFLWLPEWKELRAQVESV